MLDLYLKTLAEKEALPSETDPRVKALKMPLSQEGEVATGKETPILDTLIQVALEVAGIVLDGPAH